MLTHMQQMTFENIGAKGPLITLFSTLFNNEAIFYGDFSGFGHYVFKVVCCRFVVCGKGVKVCQLERHQLPTVSGKRVYIYYLIKNPIQRKDF